MNLQELIDILRTCDASKEVDGFGEPHSYRGYYDELAFEPMKTTVGEMLAAAESADGESYTGYKGGAYEMGGNTPVHIASYGCTGNELTKDMLANIVW